MFQIKLNESVNIPFRLVDYYDHVSPMSGVAASAMTFYYSQNGSSAKAWSSPTIIEVSSGNMPGLYYVTATSAQTSSAGPLLVGVTASGCEPTQVVVDVVAKKQVDTYNQLLATPSGMFSEAATSAYTSGTMGYQLILCRKILTNKTVDNGNSITVYDDDNTTVLGTFSWNDATGTRGKLTPP